MLFIHSFKMWIGFLSLSIAAAYAILNALAVLIWRLPKKSLDTLSRCPPVTVLKPLCGSEPGLYGHLRSFCEQDYPHFEIVFGVRDKADPACVVVEGLMAEFPQLSLKIVINSQLHGNNLKISNLINMLPHATHDFLAISDSDAFVDRDYLTKVTAPLSDGVIGLVTCIYRGVPTRNIWSRLGAMYINEWYLPSVVLAWLFGHQGYVSGQTMCLRRDTLAAIGGLEVLGDQLADDYRLGQLVRRLGLRIVLSHYVVAGQHHESSLDSVTRHELRWMRTLRVLRPASFRGLFLTFSLPLAAVGVALTAGEAGSGAARAVFMATLLARLLLHFVYRFRGDLPLFGDIWLLPARDVLTCWVWCRSFLNSSVIWRGNEFEVDRDGLMHPRF